MTVQPYLNFDGRCAEAIEFYRRATGAEVLNLLKYKDGPDQRMVVPANAEKVMHSAIRIGDTVLLASDGHCQGKSEFHGIVLSIIVDTDADAERLFAALGEGGKITQPMMTTFFASRFGMLEDRFGVGWMVLTTPK